VLQICHPKLHIKLRWEDCVEASPDKKKKVHEIPSQRKKAGCGGRGIIPAVVRRLSRRLKVQSGPGKKPDPISKITRVKRAGSVTQEVACLSNKHEALSSNLSTAKKKKD
jgi:hypothetical protein